MSNIINVEIKARCHNPENLFKKLLSLNADFIGEDHQIDTYFNVPNGRLKLREGNIENSLIYYKRENIKDAKTSKILLEKLQSKSNMHSILSSTNGVFVSVNKFRKILFIDNVKFHIDIVPGLGQFMEIEAIDNSGIRNESELREQCHYYMKILGIKETELESISYSDMLINNFEQRIHNEAHTFLGKLDSELAKYSINLDGNQLDHLCYRAGSTQSYESLKKQFSEHGEILISSIIGGREITTFRLAKAIIYKGREISIIELPDVKRGRDYLEGFEHAEFVVTESFEKIIEKHEEINFDKSAVNKTHNPELRIKLARNMSIKLHHVALDKVIESEIREEKGLNR